MAEYYGVSLLAFRLSLKKCKKYIPIANRYSLIAKRDSESAKQGFTLIEVMLAVALFAIIATVALAPLMVTVRSLKEAQQKWIVNVRREREIKKIFSQIRTAVQEGTETCVRAERASGLSVSDDDRLAVFSLLPLKQGKPACVFVYRVFKEDKLKKVAGGLYRFEFALPLDDYLLLPSASDRSPMNVDMEKLKPENGKNIVPDAVGMKVYVWQDGNWNEDYSGLIPQALKIEIKREKGTSEYEEYFSSKE